MPFTSSWGILFYLFDMSTYITAHGMTWEYYSFLNRIIDRIESEKDERIIRQEVFSCHLIAIAIVETFLNAYFQIQVEEDPNHQKHREQIYSDFKRPITLEKKLKQWPKLLYSTEINPTHSAAKEFFELKKKRNHLTHFKSSYSNLPLPGAVTMGGMADITVYQGLTITDAKATARIVEDFIGYLLSIFGVPAGNLPLVLQRWIGKVPLLPSE